MKLPKTAKRINDSRDYIDRDGSVYAMEHRKDRRNYGQWYKKSQHKCWGYCYCAIYRISQGKTVTMRVHKLVAKAFVPNDCPEVKNIVGHRNNIKHDNRAENLYWTTASENTQKAVDDGLMVNAKSWDDNQSCHVSQYETTTNKHIRDYGSAREAAEATGINLSTIMRQCRYKRGTNHSTYFRFLGDETTIINPVIIGYDMKTDKEIGRYRSLRDASRKTGIIDKTVQTDVKRNRKPRWAKDRNIYFLQRNKEKVS